MTAYQLRHQAKLLRARADDALKLADEIESLPDPIGPAIGKVVAMLARHGLCIIHKEALSVAESCMQDTEFETGESQAGYAASLAAVRIALDNGRASWVEPMAVGGAA